MFYQLDRTKTKEENVKFLQEKGITNQSAIREMFRHNHIEPPAWRIIKRIILVNDIKKMQKRTSFCHYSDLKK